MSTLKYCLSLKHHSILLTKHFAVIYSRFAFFSLIQQIQNKIDSQAKNAMPAALSPALVETCARLLIYTEIEQTVGVKVFVSK